MEDVRNMTPEQKEAHHRDAEARIRTFSYRKPDADGEVKQFASLFKSDLIRLNVQIVKEGGENNLHYHTGGDNCWMVLRGAARFYGVGDELLGEFGPNEGILLPGGSRYWFEKVGSEDPRNPPDRLPRGAQRQDRAHQPRQAQRLDDRPLSPGLRKDPLTDERN